MAKNHIIDRSRKKKEEPRNIDGGLAVGLACVRFDVARPAESCAEARRLLGR
ncbi:MAG: hypothetical protein IPP87_01515 [Ideonella sp.]|nr:hypothetical protein [Ideonella sp.]